MTAVLTRITGFFAQNTPSWPVILLGGPAALAWALLCLCIAGYLKWVHGLKTGYTRKVFHFLIFASAAVLQWVWGTPVVCLFGGAVSLVVFYAVLLGDGHPLYEALAREKDAPRRSLFILVPYFATLAGGLLSNIFFGPVAVIGYLVTGLGDAVGEPVGTRWGRHPYRVPSLHGLRCERSLEGSCAVLLASGIGIWLGIVLTPGLAFPPLPAVTISLLALCCTGVEAVSPHGWDNLTMQVVPVCLVSLLLKGPLP